MRRRSAWVAAASAWRSCCAPARAARNGTAVARHVLCAQHDRVARPRSAMAASAGLPPRRASPLRWTEDGKPICLRFGKSGNKGWIRMNTDLCCYATEMPSCAAARRRGWLRLSRRAVCASMSPAVPLSKGTEHNPGQSVSVRIRICANANPPKKAECFALHGRPIGTGRPTEPARAAAERRNTAPSASAMAPARMAASRYCAFGQQGNGRRGGQYNTEGAHSRPSVAAAEAD